MTTLAYIIIRLSSLLVPRWDRRDWIEQWRGELWALKHEASVDGSVTASRLLLFVLGAPRHALAEAVDAWSARGIATDVGQAVRRWLREPLLAAVCVAIVGLAVAANSTIFTVVNATLLKAPPGIRDSERLIQIGRGKTDGSFDNISYPLFVDIRTGATSIADVAAYADERLVLDDGAGPRLAAGQLVSARYFDVLGVALSAGREFLQEEETSAAAIAVISHELWRRRFGGSPLAVGTTISVNNIPTRIIGVAPLGFVGAEVEGPVPEIWLPLSFGGDVTSDALDRRRSWLWIVGRLGDGITIQHTRTVIEQVRGDVERTYPRSISARLLVEPGIGLHPDERVEAARITALLMGSVIIVLLIACANVSGLLLTRALTRKRELSIRLALGASRSRAIRECLVDALVVASGSSVVAFALTYWTTAALRRLLPYELAADFTPDAAVFVFTLATAIVTGLALGMLPARNAARTDLMAITREQLGGSFGTRGRATLLVIQLSLSFVLVTGAAILVRSIDHARRVDPGFDADNVVAMSLATDRVGWDSDRTALFLETVSEALSTLQGVAAVGIARRLPIADAQTRRAVSRDVLDPADGSPVTAVWNAVDSGYFHALGIPILRGRGVAETDRPGSEPVAVVSESLARILWGSEDPLGRTLQAGFDRVRVVGVVADVAARSIRQGAEPAVYVPLLQQPVAALAVLVRASPATAIDALLPRVRSIVQQYAPEVPIARAAVLRSLLGNAMGEARLTATLLGLYGGLALLLSVVGLYALMSQLACQRRAEFGVRLALGASPSHLRQTVLTSALRLVLLAVVVGGGASVLASRAIERLVYGTTAVDPWAMFEAAGLFVVCGLAAAAVPAWRAASVDPVVSLRAH